MKARVIVMPKKSVMDPQGEAVRNAIAAHGLPCVRSVRIGKMMEIELDAAGLSAAAAETRLRAICADLLSNPVIEDYALEIEAQP